MYVETSWRYFLPSQRNGLTQFLTQHVRRVNLSFEAKTRRFHNYVEVIFGVLRRRQNTSPFIGAAACEQKTKTHPNTRILNGENAPLRYHVSNTETVKRGLPRKKKNQHSKTYMASWTSGQVGGNLVGTISVTAQHYQTSLCAWSGKLKVVCSFFFFSQNSS